VSSLRGVTFEVLPFNSYALGTTMLQLFESFFFFEILLWISFSAGVTLL